MKTTISRAYYSLPEVGKKWSPYGFKDAWLKQAEYDVFIPSKSKELTE